MKKLSQEDRVLRHLEDNNGITTWEAIREYGITRLSAKIFTLRKKGYNIINEWVYSRNRYDEPVKYVRYKLESNKKNWWENIRFFM